MSSVVLPSGRPPVVQRVVAGHLWPPVGISLAVLGAGECLPVERSFVHSNERFGPCRARGGLGSSRANVRSFLRAIFGRTAAQNDRSFAPPGHIGQAAACSPSNDRFVASNERFGACRVQGGVRLQQGACLLVVSGASGRPAARTPIRSSSLGFWADGSMERAFARSPEHRAARLAVLGLRVPWQGSWAG